MEHKQSINNSNAKKKSSYKKTNSAMDDKTTEYTLPKDFKPGQDDVIIGRGKQCYDHTGNKKLREIINSRIELYKAALTKGEKSKIICSIIEEVRNGEGGFIKQNIPSLLWFDVGDFIAKEKISQTFRDALSDSYKSSNVYKKKRRQQLKKSSRNCITTASDYEGKTAAGEWYERYKELVDFYNTCRHCNVPPDWENTKLLYWVTSQRQQYQCLIDGKKSSLDDAKVNLLKSIGFQFWVNNKSAITVQNDQNNNVVSANNIGDMWHARYTELLEFRKAFGHCNVPHNWTNKGLANWVKEQRQKYKLIQSSANQQSQYFTLEKFDLLESIGFRWIDPQTQNLGNGIYDEEDWTMRYKELVEFFRENGHCFVQQQMGSSQKYLNLFNWGTFQRKQYKIWASGLPSTMTKERFELLNAIGFLWNDPNFNPESMYQKTMAAIDHNISSIFNPLDQNNVSSIFNTHAHMSKIIKHNEALSNVTPPIGRPHINNLVSLSPTDIAASLSSSVNTKSGSIVDARRSTDDLDSDADNWAENLETLKKFHKENGHCNVLPSQDKQNQQLIRWTRKQTTHYNLYYEGKSTFISAAQIVKLEKLGFDYDDNVLKISD